MTRQQFDGLEVTEIMTLCGLPFNDLGDRVALACPYPHQKSNATARVYKSTRVFKCHDCGKARSLAGFYEDQTGIRLVDGAPDLFYKKPTRAPPKKEVALEKPPLEIVGEFTALEDDTDALDYIIDRHIPPSFLCDFNVVSASNLVTINETPMIRRLMIPIIESGKIISYEGRDYTRKARAKVLYPKNVQNPIFNVDNLNRDETLICVEGLIDLAILYGYGYTNITTYMGTQISVKQQAQLKDFKKVILFLDGDEAGEKVIDTFERFYPYDFRVSQLKANRDPKYGTPEEIEEALRESMTPNEFLLTKFGFLNKATRDLFD